MSMNKDGWERELKKLAAEEEAKKLLQIGRTVSIIRELAKGKTLDLGGPYPMAMGENLEIGYLYVGHVVGDLTFSELNGIFEKMGIGPAIPSDVGR